MTPADAVRHPRPVTPDSPAIRLLVEIAPGDDPVTGRIGPGECGDDGMREFIGWTELAAAIERLRRAAENPIT
jgi:hypothetical protein